MYGAVLGATLFVVAQNYLQDAMKLISGALKGVPSFLQFVPELFHPDRWLLWFGVLFVISVYYFPSGIVGYLRRR
jgi:branched-chain amino acid transport system permease protein